MGFEGLDGGRYVQKRSLGIKRGVCGENIKRLWVCENKDISGGKARGKEMA